MPPSAIHDDVPPDSGNNVMELASQELEMLRMAETGSSYQSFPPACHDMLMTIDGNHRCMDCGVHNPQWAALRYGALLCLECSGRHRSLGVQISCVRSLTMDSWSLNEIIAMLEGGNSQLQGFFSRHALCTRTIPDATRSENNTNSKVINEENVMLMRYKTKAALFYRGNLQQHVTRIIHSGPYRGREHSRKQQEQEELRERERQMNCRPLVVASATATTTTANILKSYHS